MENPKERMNADEIRELLALTGWRKQRLASELGVANATITFWLGGTPPRGPAKIVLRQLLAEARRQKEAVHA